MKKKIRNGFTLLEALLIITILSIMTATAVPSGQRLIDYIKLERYSDELYNDLSSIKIAAVSIGQPYTMTFSNNEWVLSTNNKNVKEKKTNNEDLYISSSKSKIEFDTIGFVLDSYGNKIIKEEIIICSKKIETGYKMIINTFGKIKVEENECK